ncbi:MAG: ATP-binding cassette domain-containing protein [Rhodobacteraceae bacterium]|nr:ATP-binding cassette domain-containing protein [Paracoccaceae bacterium]
MSDNQAEFEARQKSRSVRPLVGLMPYLKPYWLLLTIAAIALTVTAALSLALPLAVRRVIDGFFEDDAAVMDQYFGATIGIAALLAIGTGLRYYFVTRLGERVIADIRKAVYDKMIGVSPAFFDRIMTGEVLSRMSTDTTLILAVIGSAISVALRNILLLGGGIILMFLTSFKLTGVALLIVPVVIVPILLLGRRVRRLSRMNQDKIAESTAHASETLLAVQTVQAFTHEAHSRATFGLLTEEAFEATRARIGARATMTMIVIFFILTGIVGVLWIGAHDVRTGDMTPGTLAQFLIYAIIVAGAVSLLSDIWTEVQRAAGATERLVELLAAPDIVLDPEIPVAHEPATGALAFAGVDFAYPSRPGLRVLDGFDIDIKPGEMVAIVGPSGAGKSTVFHLLLRFFDPDAGQVSMDGVDLRHMKRDTFRSRMAYVPQDPVIFATTALENIRFGHPDATDAEVFAAAQAAAADEFLSALPDGYKTYVGERGVMLSGGQKQRIAIARAILHDAPVLLLDEATSALDAESENAVQTAIHGFARNRTTLIVAHRLATVKRADRIIVMESGKVVATGTHASLVEEDGLYARLARLQFTGELAAA